MIPLSFVFQTFWKTTTREWPLMIKWCLRQILEDYMPPSDLDSFANILVVVKTAHDRLFRDMMDFIRYFHFKVLVMHVLIDLFISTNSLRCTKGDSGYSKLVPIFFFYISYSDKYVYSYIGIVWRLIILSVLKSKFNDVIGLQDFFEQLRFFWLKRVRQSELFHLTRKVWCRRTALTSLVLP